MNRITQRVIHVLMAGLVFAVLAAAPVFGQTNAAAPPPGPPPLPTPTPVKIDPRVICEIHRAPIPFKPFEMRDPETGAPVTPLTRIRVLKGTKGEKIILAGLYYDYINGYERYLNERGYTLRLTKDDPDEILLQRTCIDLQLMQRQSKDIEAKHLKLPPGSLPLYTELTPETVARLISDHQQQTARDPARLKRVELGKRCDIDPGFEEEKEKTFGFDLGAKDTFWVGVNGHFLLAPKRDPLEVTVEGEAKAQTELFGSGTVDLLRATANAHAVEKGDLTAEITLSVLGKSIWTPSLPPGTAAWSKTDTFTKSFDYHKDFEFTVGPIPMVARVGARGNISLKYFVGLRPLNAQADINPSVFSEAYVEGGVDLLIAEAGVGGSLTLLNDKLNIYAEIGIDGDDKGIFYYKHFSGTNELSALDGDLYLYAKIDAPWPFSDKKWKYELWNWEGVSEEGTLFNVTPSETKVYLFLCPPNDARFIAQSVPGTMTAGRQYLVSVTMRNTGQNTWIASQNYKLGSWNPENNTTWGFSRVELPVGASGARIQVPPGEQVTFNFNVTAPSVAGNYIFQWKMLREGVVGWFGDPTRRTNVGSLTGTISAAPNPIRVCDGSGKGEATLNWFGNSPALEVHTGAPNGPLFARTGSSGSAATGKTVTDGTVFYLQNVANGLPLTAINTLATVRVNLTTSGCPPNNADFISQSVPTVMNGGQSYPVSVTLKNTGTTTWTWGKAYRLGSQYPPDNLLWGLNRVELPVNLNDPARSRVTVPPGGQVTFTFTVKPPRVPGPTPFYFQWQMVQDGVEWFGQPTTNTMIIVMP